MRELRLRRTLAGNIAAQVAGGIPTLRVLGLSGTRIDDKGVASLAGLQNLEELRLADTAITDASLETIGQLASLQRLDLERTAVTDAGLASLSGLTELKSIWLSGSQITAAGLQTLRGMPNLELISVAGIEGESDVVTSVLADNGTIHTLYLSPGLVDEETVSDMETRDKPLYLLEVAANDSISADQ